jgi:hypothetical protein
MKKVICSFSSPVTVPGFEPRTLSTNNKRAKPLNHAAALLLFFYLSLFPFDIFFLPLAFLSFVYSFFIF